MNKTVIMLMGRSGCGKSTLERNLVAQYPKAFYKVVSITTRPMRDGEVDGVDYWFIDRTKYEDYDAYGEVAQKTVFADNLYGSLFSEYLTPHPFSILVVVPSSAETFIKNLKHTLPGINVILVYFDISNERLRTNMLARGDTPEYADKRLAVKDNEEVQFKASGLTADFTITDDLLTPTLPTLFIDWLAVYNESHEGLK